MYWQNNLVIWIVGLLGLSGCSALQPQVVKLKPPVDLLAVCPTPVVDVTKNQGLVNGLLAYADALDQCNNDKAALRAWSDKE